MLQKGQFTPPSISVKANAAREKANFLFGNLLTFPLSSFTKSWWFGGQSQAPIGGRTGSESLLGHQGPAQRGTNPSQAPQSQHIPRQLAAPPCAKPAAAHLGEVGDASQLQQAWKIQSRIKI